MASTVGNSSDAIVFTLYGLNETKSTKLLFFAFTLQFYLLVIFLNLTLVATVLMEKSLQEPMYIFICNLSVNSLYGTAGLYPKLLSDFLSDTHVISYIACITQIVVIYSFLFCEFTTLTVMAYDRYVAICKPLEYHAVMTPLRVFKFLLISWLLPFSDMIIPAVLMIRLPLCGSHIDKLYCENWAVVKLSCVDTTLNNLSGYVLMLKYTLQFFFIVYSYILIIIACVKTSEGRSKFMQTCMPHLISLISFMTTFLFDALYTRYGARNVPQALRNIMAVEFLVIPPLLNPLIYGLNLAQIRRTLLKLCNKSIKPYT